MEVEKLKGLDGVDVCMQNMNFLIGSLEDHTAYLLKHFMPMKLYPSTIKRATTGSKNTAQVRMNV